MSRLSDRAWYDLNGVDWAVKPQINQSVNLNELISCINLFYSIPNSVSTNHMCPRPLPLHNLSHRHTSTALVYSYRQCTWIRLLDKLMNLQSAKANRAFVSHYRSVFVGRLVLRILLFTSFVKLVYPTFKPPAPPPPQKKKKKKKTLKKLRGHIGLTLPVRVSVCSSVHPSIRACMRPLSVALCIRSGTVRDMVLKIYISNKHEQ